MKKLINRPGDCVREMMRGLAALHPQLMLVRGQPVLIRADAGELRHRQVALVSGGGSGHEPAHAGYVGAGLLSAAVAGEVFASPSPEAVLAAIQAVGGEAGVLLIVKNYTGDRLNFGLAAEMARSEGIETEMVLVADDVALTGSDQYAGARGLAGTVLVHKIAGAAAAAGLTLAQVSAMAREAAQAVATMGVALSAGTMPTSGKATFVIGDDEVELGLEIHGEPGVERVKLGTAAETAEQLIERIVSVQGLRAGESIAVLVNNLGATTEMELAIFSAAALTSFRRRGLQVERLWAGTYMTSLEMAGVSISTLRLTPERLRYLDASTSAFAWHGGSAQEPGSTEQSDQGGTVEETRLEGAIKPSDALNAMQSAIRRSCEALIAAEAELDELDRAVGDGDIGTSLARGARQVDKEIEGFGSLSAPAVLKQIGMTMQRSVGGSSGALYGAFFLRAASVLARSGTQKRRAWAEAGVAGCQAISELGGASSGERTMLDALMPFFDTFLQALDRGEGMEEGLRLALGAAEQGAAATESMQPRRGRSTYLGERALGHPDPGAKAAALWLGGLVR